MQVLLRRFVERRTREQLATLYSLDLEHADLLVWKAARSLEAALHGQPEPDPLPLTEELAAAHAFAASPLASSLALTEHREVIQKAILQANLNFMPPLAHYEN